MGFCLAFFLATVACAHVDPRQCRVLRGADEVLGKDLVDIVDRESARSRLFAIADSPPGDPGQVLSDWFEADWAAFVSGIPNGATIYWFKEPKGGLGYRQGVIAVRGCRIVRASVLLEDN